MQQRGLARRSLAANVNGQILSFNIAAFAHAFAKRVQHGGRRRGGRENSNPGLPKRRSGLLCARSKRPRRSPAEQRDKIAAFHSITSSAVASSFSGTVRPRL